MVVLAGEWVNANLLFSLAFLVAAGGVVGLAWYVLRGDRLNRAGELEGDGEPAAHPTEKAP